MKYNKYIIILLIYIFFYGLSIITSDNWKSTMNKLGNTTVSVGIYDMSKANTTYASDTKNMKVRDMMKGKGMMIKETCAVNEMQSNKIINHMFKGETIYPDTFNLICRIQNYPWKHSAHFDCTDQIITSKHGTKTWLLWNMPIHFENNKLFLEKYENNYDELKSFLINNSIHFKEVVQNEGDVVRIPAGQWHTTKDDTSKSKGCILITQVIGESDSVLQGHWDKLWPYQSILCKHNKCVYSSKYDPKDVN